MEDREESGQGEALGGRVVAQVLKGQFHLLQALPIERTGLVVGKCGFDGGEMGAQFPSVGTESLSGVDRILLALPEPVVVANEGVHEYGADAAPTLPGALGVAVPQGPGTGMEYSTDRSGPCRSRFRMRATRSAPIRRFAPG